MLRAKDILTKWSGYNRQLFSCLPCWYFKVSAYNIYFLFLIRLLVEQNANGNPLKAFTAFKWFFNYFNDFSILIRKKKTNKWTSKSCLLQVYFQFSLHSISCKIYSTKTFVILFYESFLRFSIYLSAFPIAKLEIVMWILCCCNHYDCGIKNCTCSHIYFKNAIVYFYLFQVLQTFFLI